MKHESYVDQLLRKRPDLNTDDFKHFAIKFNKSKIRSIYDLSKDDIDRVVAFWDNRSNRLRQEQKSGPKINAPTFAFQTLYDKDPPQPIRGKREHYKQKVFNVDIDKAIPKKAIQEIMKIEEIEPRSSCEGESELRPTFLIFRPKNQNKKFIENLVKNLEKQDKIKASYNVGMGQMYRVCVTWKIWAGQEGFEEWWNKLPGKIKAALRRAG